MSLLNLSNYDNRINNEYVNESNIEKLFEEMLK